MSQGRTLPLLGPGLVVYLAIELVSSAGALDSAAVVLVALGVLASLAPIALPRPGEVDGARRLSFLAVAAGVLLVAKAQPGVLSLGLELAEALAAPAVLGLVVDVAIDVPDRPARLYRAGALRTTVIVLASLVALVCVLAAMPVIDVLGVQLLVPASTRALLPGFAIASIAIALVLRVLRRRLGSAPDALAANGWASLGLLFAAISFGLAATLVMLGVYARGEAPVRGLEAGAIVALVLGHAGMLDARRPIGAARATRRVLALALVLGSAGTVIGLVADRVPRDPVALGVTAAAFVVAVGLLHRFVAEVLDRALAPDMGRLLRAVAAAEARLAGARSLDEIAAAVLPPLRAAARSTEAQPMIVTTLPGREARIDAASLPHVASREPSPAVLERIVARPGEIIVRAPLAAVVVRRPELRGLVDVLDASDALCVVPIAISGEIEGALFVPRGRRRAPVTLEELAALERLGARLSSLLALGAAEVRAERRAQAAQQAAEKLEERVEALTDELTRLRVDARILKAGRAADRLAAPAIAYSPAMRALLARISEIAPLDAPVQLVSEGGNPVDAIGHLIHAASSVREGPYVIADCTAVRPERAAAALFGDESEGQQHPGWLRLAHGGTLLLVDVPALSPDTQRALAEAVATRTARPEGGASAYDVQVRLVATSRMDVGALAKLGALDEELSRRLTPLTLELPPLRERREDLPSLVLLALDRSARVLGKPVPGIDDGAMARLVGHAWPGNVRELWSVIDRAVARATGSRVTIEDLPPLQDPTTAAAHETAADPFAGTWADIERRALEAALARSAGNKSEAARTLGLARTTFLDKLRRAGLETADRPSEAPGRL